jgi:hypothetical protein
MLKEVEPELPFLKCLCMGDAIGLSRGVAHMADMGGIFVAICFFPATVIVADW